MSKPTATQPDRKRVLVVDDEQTLRQVVADCMNNAGHEVVEAANGRIALEVLTRRSVDVIITDVKMPELGGRGLYEQLRLSRRDLLDKFIVITGREDHDTEFFARKTTVPILQKPFSLRALSAAVAAILRRELPGRAVSDTSTGELP